jgi:hypothetical protein
MNSQRRRALSRVVFSTVFLLALSANGWTNDVKGLVKLSAAYHMDSRHYSTAGIIVSSNKLPGGFSLWGFSDFHGDQESNNHKVTRSFSEYRLSHGIASKIIGVNGFALQAEINALSGKGNDLTRLGLVYKHKLPLLWQQEGWLQWRAFPWESDHNGGQVSLIYFVPLTSRLHLQGFADYNVADKGPNRWVIEPELSYKLGRNISALVEYRYNQYEENNPSVKGAGLAVGVRYQFGG